MNVHKTKTIIIEDKEIEVDIEMVGIIENLNRLGYKTSGCCIGEYLKNDTAWIVIQETDELMIINLLRALQGCSYVIEKSLYVQNNRNSVYVHYVLKTPCLSYDSRVEIINEWRSSLVNKILDTYKSIDEIKYKTINALF